VLSDIVRIPIRIICTTDEGVAEAVITATNRQTEVKEEQFFALKHFAKKLEAFFKSLDILKRLYYERRAHQYDSSNIEKTRIIPHKDLVRAVGAMFFQEPIERRAATRPSPHESGAICFCRLIGLSHITLRVSLFTN
jgi:AIPR protein